MNTLSPATQTYDAANDAVARSTASTHSGQLYRLVLAIAVAVAGGMALALTVGLGPGTQVEPDLVRLLHGMVLIKGLFGLVAAAMVSWRFGRLIERPLAFGYIACLCVSAAALGWLWGLEHIVLASALFYAGLGGLLLVGRRDPLLSDVRPSGR